MILKATRYMLCCFRPDQSTISPNLVRKRRKTTIRKAMKAAETLGNGLEQARIVIGASFTGPGVVT